MSRYRSQTSRWSIFDKRNLLEILLMLLLMWVQNIAYNGLILLGFCGYLLWLQRVEYQERSEVLVCLYPSELLDAPCNQFRRLFAFLPNSSLDTYIHFYPESIRILAFFLKNSLYALNMVLFIISLLFYIMNVLAENHEVEQELAMVSKVNTELNNYMALSEKIAEDRERKRIAGRFTIPWDTR